VLTEDDWTFVETFNPQLLAVMIAELRAARWMRDAQYDRQEIVIDTKYAYDTARAATDALLKGDGDG
jgi:hypothetical protein